MNLVAVINSRSDMTDKAVVYHFLSTQSYWAKDIPYDIFEKSLKNSLCFNALFNDQQVGFARVITDYATYGYLADVFVLDEFRGKGISKQLMRAIIEHPELQRLRRITLATSDAHGLYRQFGFTQLETPEIFMEKRNLSIYQQLKQNKTKIS
ncbi:GNAT family N-acetyltransferase [Aliikangiella sp. G2MR2-5]|uniref:GNAT family N-acetyltransferase n=1 Tax=Aliikangiella sp. G2MR2-5 TaxID=2788943 RepID=UPI0018A8E897|nr:GNAT family N-acetyltransferase [Aliikangiella sp. G2MR2-5]